MNPRNAALVLAFALALAGCASRNLDSEREWQRAQCANIIDSEARDKCMKSL